MGKKGLTVIDMGANVGFFTQYAKRFAKRVIAIEPSKETFAFLEQAKNENNWSNVDLVNTAISAETKEGVAFFHNENNTTMRSLDPRMSHGSVTELVSVLSLSDLFKKYNINHVDFMKMDVEGAELDIIKSDGFKKVLPMINTIELEVHFTGSYTAELFDLFHSYGLNVQKAMTAVNVYILKK